MLGMNQFNQNKTNRKETWAKIEKVMDFYVPVGVILIELEDCSDYASGIAGGGLPHDEIDFVSSSDYTESQTRTAFLCIGYDGTWVDLSSVNSKQ
jgi:hypothetical protein